MEILPVLVFLPFVSALHACASPDIASVKPPVPLASTINPTANAPPGFAAFCERSPAQCSSVVPLTMLPLDAHVWETLQAVNMATNLTIAPKSDQLHYGVEEYWTIPTDGYGDCDDYVLAKRSALIARGIPESALRIAIVFTPRFVRHTVLTVSTDKGTFVLDNLRNDIVSWDNAEYGWIKHQDAQSRSGWAYF